jgi:hypothetical protein
LGVLVGILRHLLDFDFIPVTANQRKGQNHPSAARESHRFDSWNMSHLILFKVAFRRFLARQSLPFIQRILFPNEQNVNV